MPRKRRRIRQRSGLTWDVLTFADKFALEAGFSEDEPGSARAGNRIRSMDDAREAWGLNRDQYMHLRLGGFFSGFFPGSRPWGWWRFDMGYADPPRMLRVAGCNGWQSDEAQELKRLGEITPDEAAMLDAIDAKEAEIQAARLNIGTHENEALQ